MGDDVVDAAVRGIGVEPRRRSTLRRTAWTHVERVETSAGALVAKTFTAPRAGLDPHSLARKVELVASGLSPAVARVPEVLAVRESAGAAVVVTPEVAGRPWAHGNLLAAARTLRRLHDVDVAGVSAELDELLRATEPNRRRVQIGVQMRVAEWKASGREVPQWIADLAAIDEPWPEVLVPVHGDYFAANLIADDPADVTVVDWDLCGYGDRVWDLAFLLAAAGPPSDDDVDAVLHAYGPLTRGDADRLELHLAMWRAAESLD